MLKQKLLLTLIFSLIFTIGIAEADVVPQFSTVSVVVKRGEMYSFNISFFNNGPLNVTPISIETMPFGAEWITVQYSLPTRMYVGSSTTALITIDASYLEEGNYDAKVILDYKENNTVRHTSTDIKIYVTKENPSFIKPNITVIMPSSIDVNQTFDITINGYSKKTQVMIDITPKYFILDSVETEGSQYIARYRFTAPGIYTVIVRVYSMGSIYKKFEKEVYVGGVTKKHILVDYVIIRNGAVVTDTPRGGDVLKIKRVWCNETREDLNIYVYVNNKPYVVPSSIKLVSGETYELSASLPGYEPFNKIIETEKRKLSVKYTQGPYIEGMRFVIQSVKDAETGNEVEGYRIFVNGECINKTSFTLRHKNYTIEIKKEGYENWILNLTPRKKIEISYSGSIHPKDKVTIELPRAVSWEIRYSESNGELVEKGSGSKITFIPAKEGSYFLIADEDGYKYTMGVINVSSILPHMNYSIIIMIVVIAGFGALIFWLIKSGKLELKRGRKGISWEMESGEPMYPIEEE